MADRTYGITDIVGTSPQDVNQAIRNGVTRASRTLRNLDWFELVEVRGAISDGEVNHYQVTLKIGLGWRTTSRSRRMNNCVRPARTRG
jgi:flavin-binding protein dodecin